MFQIIQIFYILTFKIWAKTVVILFFVLLVGTNFLVSVVIDPYDDLNLFKEDFNKKKFRFSYNTTPFKLFNKLKKNRYDLVFGTSRTGRFNSSMVRGYMLNFSALYANPADVYNVIVQLSEQQKKNIGTIYYLVDTHVFKDKTSLYEKLNLNSKLDYYKQVFFGLDMKKIESAISCVKKNFSGSNQYVDEYGASIFENDPVFNPATVIEHYRIPSFTKDSIDYLKKIDIFCKTNNIKIKYFTPVYNIWYLRIANMDLYKKQFKAFLSAIDGIYDFHLVDDISYDYKNFSDSDHFNTDTSRKVMLSLQNEENVTFVTKENIDGVFNLINKKIEKARNAN